MAVRKTGSALYDDFGNMTFTAFNHNPEENSPWLIIKATPHGVIKSTPNIVTVKLTVKRGLPKAMVDSLNKEFPSLICCLLEKEVQKKMKKQIDDEAEKIAERELAKYEPEKTESNDTKELG